MFITHQFFRMMKFIAICLAILAEVTLAGLGRTQSSGARGVLTCNGKPASDVLVKLYDDDRGNSRCILIVI